MLNKLLLVLTLCISFLYSFNQGTTVYSPNLINDSIPFPGEPCASDYLDRELLKNPAYAQLRANMETYIKQQSSSRSGGRGVVYTIPVVFHVMHSGEAVGDSTNISLAQVQSAIDALNRDFRRTTADGGIASSGPLGVDAEIEFCLAQRDPSGNASTGVTRHDMSGNQNYLDSGVYHTASLWRHDGNMKATVQWNPAQYLNVWVVNKIRNLRNIYTPGGFTGGVIGYATFPGGTAARDGVVILSAACGSDPSGTNGHNLWSATDDGRVLTHEVGHYLFLYHTFQSTSACGTSGVNCATIGDRCCDTPPTTVGAGNNCTSPVCPLANKENYMDYQNGACASDFTPDQVARMRAVLASNASWGRNPLVSTNNCVAPPAIDLELDTIFHPIDTICSLSFIPEIVVCNTSATDSATSFDIKYRVDAGAETNFNWTGNLQAGQCDTFFLPSVTSTNGVHTFTARVDSITINGGDIDIDPSNNSKTNSFTLSSSTIAPVQIISACDSFVAPSGKVIKTNGPHNDTLINRYKCDSILSYSVTILSPTITNINLSGCDSVVSPSGKVYKTSGVYSDTVSALPCDSIYNITITINQASIGDSIAFEWARRLGGTSAGIGNSIVSDANGSVYTVGSFQGTFDFDPGAGVFNLTSAGSDDIFISKLDATGNFVWAKRIGSSGLDRGMSIAIDDLGDIFVTGRFNSSVDFDPNAGTFNLNGGSAGMFILKLDGTGNFVFANAVGGTLEGRSIGLDAAGNIYTAGFLGGMTATDFDPGPGVTNLTPAGSIDGFVSKFDALGNFVWAKSFGGVDTEQTRGMTVDPSGNTYTTGSFNGTADFNPGAGVFNLTSSISVNTDIFILKLDALGNFVWARRIGSPGNDEGKSIITDGQGNVYTTGWYVGTTDFDPGVGTTNLIGAGQYDVFISKLDASGNFVWARGIGSTSYDVGYSIKTDVFNKVYLTGTYQGTVDFDPSAGTHNLTSAGSNDVYITKFDASGNFVWVKDIKGTGQVISSSIDVDKKGNIHSTGRFQNTADFDPKSSVFNLTSAGNYDSYVHKLSQEFLIIDSACGSYTAPSGQVWTSTGIYFDSLTNVNGCDSILKFDLAITPQFIDSITASACQTYSWRGNTYTNSGLYSDTIFGVCDSIYFLNLVVDTIVTNVIDTTLCFGDSLVLLNGTKVKTTGTYYDTIADTSGGSMVVSSILYSEDFEGSTHSFTLNTNDAGSITPGTVDNAWIVNNSYAGGTFLVAGIIPVTIPNTPNQNAAITGNINSKYLHIHSRYAQANSTPGIVNCNYLDASLSSFGGTNGMNFSRMTSDISTVGKSNVSFNMYFLCKGSYGRVYYSTNSGTTWTQVGGAFNDSVWKDTTITNAIFDNQATLRFGVAFNNTNTPVTDPAYAVDEISIESQDTVSGSGCDSIVRYNVTVLPFNDTTIFDTICSDQGYTLPGGGMPTASGTYRDTLVSSAGCDSIIITNLQVNDTSSSIQTITTCDSLISPSGKVWRTTGTFLDTINNSAGCDSLMTFNLTISSVVINNLPPVTACDSAQIRGTWYYTSQTVSDTIIGGAAAGCDSVVNTNLTIDTSTWSIITVSVCDSLVTGSGKVFTNSGYYRDTMPNGAGCDSLVEYYLTVNYTTYSNIITSMCDSFISPSGKIFKTTGAYQDTVLKSSGCDSIISIYVVIDTPSFVTLDTTICHDDSLLLSNGTSINTTGTYFDTILGTSGSYVLYSEDFEGTTHTFLLNTTDTNAITPGTSDNAWIVNNNYAGGNVFTTPVPATPNQNAAVTGSTTSKYLHIHNRRTATLSFPSIRNANYIDGSITLLGGQNGLNFTKMSTDISTVGMDYVSFEMYYLCRGSWGRLYYSTNSGTTWTRVGGNFNNGGTQWSTVSVVDPAFANQATIRFAFGFNNTDGGVGSSPGFAVDEIAIRGVSADSAICDSITQINLTVTPIYRDTITDTVCESRVWRGMTLTSTGVYSDTVFTACDSIFVLNLQVDTIKRSTVDTTLCFGDSIVLLSGTIAKITGTYFDTISILPCDSTITYNVTVLPINDTILFDTICATDSYTLPGGGLHSGSGTYRDTLPSTIGCDSIVVLNLIVNDTSSSSFPLAGCDSVISPSGKIWTISGAYNDTIVNAAGCDSLMNITVTISTIFRDTITDTVCDSIVWRSTVYSSTGIYRDTVTSTGCDSIYSLNLVVNNSSFNSTTVVACDSFMLPSGTTVYTSGTYNDTLMSVGGCDSILSTSLTIGTGSTSTISPSACASYTSPSGKVWTTSGTYNDTIANSSGCDSILTINLTITPSSSITVLANGCDTYTLPGGGTVTTSGTYRDTLMAGNGCDSIIVTNLILGQSSNLTNTYSLCAGETVMVGGNTYGATGVYRDTFLTTLGCDSIIVTNLTINSLTPASITFTTDMCEDASPVRFTATPFGGKWGGNGIDTTTGLFDPSTFGAGIYTITYTAPGPCGVTDTAIVTVFSSPTIVATITDDECDVGVGAIDVTITGGTAPITYTWSNGAVTEDQAGLKAGTYTLSVVDVNGCTDSRTVSLINLNSDTCDYNIFVPNIFSPNGDGENDVLQVEGAGIQTVELIIYNRWGNLIFESRSQAVGWDGNFQGKPANPDVFVYYVKGTFVDGETFSQKGTVTLIRR